MKVEENRTAMIHPIHNCVQFVIYTFPGKSIPIEKAQRTRKRGREDGGEGAKEKKKKSKLNLPAAEQTENKLQYLT